MAGLTFCFNRRQGTISTALILGEGLQPGYRVQIREQRVYGQIWEGIVDGNQLCVKQGVAGAFVGFRAVLNTPAECSDVSNAYDPPVGSGNPDVNPVVVNPPGPVNPPLPDPPAMSCPDQVEGGQLVEVIVADFNGKVISCDECSAMMFP